MARDSEGRKRDRGGLSCVAPNLAELLRRVEPIREVFGNPAPQFTEVIRALHVPLQWPSADCARAEARRPDAIAPAELSSLPPGRSYIETLVHRRTPVANRERLAVELAKRWSTDGGKTAARCTSKDLKARVRVHLQVAAEAHHVQHVYLYGRRVRDQRPVDLSPRDLAHWFVNRATRLLGHQTRRARPVGRRLTSKRQKAITAARAQKRSGQ